MPSNDLLNLRHAMSIRRNNIISRSALVSVKLSNEGFQSAVCPTHGCFNPLNWWTFRPTPRNFKMAIISPSNGCNDLYPLEFAVQLLNGTRGDLLDEVLLKMKLCSTEKGVFGHQEMLRSGEVSFKSGLLTRR